MRIDHVALWTSDLERCKRFYTAYFGAVAGTLHVNAAKGFTHLAISVGSEPRVDELTNRLRSDGYEVLDGPRRTGDGYYESVVLDPDGNRIEITQ